MSLKPVEFVGRALRKVGTEILRRNGIHGTWIDVGAHHGEMTLGSAALNPGLTVYAFEPNLPVAAALIGRAANFFVIPMAIAEKDGCAEFHVNASEQSSSLLTMNERGVKTWIGGEVLRLASTRTVPTIRLDTFMGLARIEKVDFLKIDAQGMDLAVVRSAGSRLRDIHKIVLEVSVAATPVYVGEPSKQEVVRFMSEAGFSLEESQRQTYGQEENLTFGRLDQS